MREGKLKGGSSQALEATVSFDLAHSVYCSRQWTVGKICF